MDNKSDVIKLFIEIVTLGYVMGADENGVNPYFEELDDDTKELISELLR